MNMLGNAHPTVILVYYGYTRLLSAPSAPLHYLFYRNIFIELGVLLPLSIGLILTIRDGKIFGKSTSITAIGVLISIYFMNWASRLSR